MHWGAERRRTDTIFRKDEATKADPLRFKIVYRERLEETLGVDERALILVALLSGGDYDEVSLQVLCHRASNGKERVEGRGGGQGERSDLEWLTRGSPSLLFFRLRSLLRPTLPCAPGSFRLV